MLGFRAAASQGWAPLLALALISVLSLGARGALLGEPCSPLVGSLAILGMFALVRAAGGGPWVAVGSAALMAADNLLIVHGRIATLDVYALAAMIWAAVLYLRGRPLLAGAVVAWAPASSSSRRTSCSCSP